MSEVCPVVCFFGMAGLDVERFCGSIAKGLSGQGAEVFYLVDDPASYGSAIEVNATFSVIYTTNMKISQIESLLSRLNTMAVVFHAIRPPDSRVILACKRLGVNTIYLQHGLYVPFMKRTWGFFLRRAAKVFRMLRYAADIAVELSDARVFGNIVATYLFGSTRWSLKTHAELKPHYSFVWSTYWSYWHSKYYFLADESMHVVGNPDLHKFRFYSVAPDSLLIIYQTLAEDGRIDEYSMRQLWTDLYREYSDRYTMYVKWHPRGAAECRQRLEAMGYLVVDDIPITTAVIGLYSSLLGVFPLKGVPVYVAELPEHPIPKSIASFSRDIASLNDGILPVTDREKEKALWYFGGEYSDQALIGAIMRNVG